MATSDMVTSMVFMFDTEAFVLINPKATHSFIFVSLLHVLV